MKKTLRSFDELLDLLKPLAGTFQIQEGMTAFGAPTRLIRNADGACPLCALANWTHAQNGDPRTFWQLAAYHAMQSLGYDLDDPTTEVIRRIMVAADFLNHDDRPALEHALGLST